MPEEKSISILLVVTIRNQGVAGLFIRVPGCISLLLSVGIAEVDGII